MSSPLGRSRSPLHQEVDFETADTAAIHANANRMAAALRIQTDIDTIFGNRRRQSSASSSRTASLFDSPGAAVTPTEKMTPLPSPIVGSPSSTPGRNFALFHTDPVVPAGAHDIHRHKSMVDMKPGVLTPDLPDDFPRRKTYIPEVGRSNTLHVPPAIMAARAASGHARTHSDTDQMSPTMPAPRPNPIRTFSNYTPPDVNDYRAQYSAVPRSQPQLNVEMTREMHQSYVERRAVNGDVKEEEQGSEPSPEGYVDAYTIETNYTRKGRWKVLRKLGKGAFSDVVLAARLDQEGNFNPNDRARLAAVKIVPFVAAAGANKERIESSVRRELDILRVMRHPNLIRLLGFDICSRNADIVLNYSPGGDLFELASTRRELLSPKFVRRLFAEMVRAVEYLHSKNFVHRDLKLENVLLNLLPDELADIQWPDTFPRPITTLTDLGLSRAIDPNNPLLTTRCGSEDYAAPELLMGQPYDGRQTDAWALGVILYAIIEGRLPFDAVPGMEQKMRGRPSHRIARVEWRWIRLASKDDQKDYEPEWEGAKDIVEGLLRRRDKRWSMKEIAEHDWVRGGLMVSLE
ncbi:hypothetical protein G7K_3001-t1 [Saitoella complicata NRRL Y-17804]|uniref:Protein kinase domain-containing protein n=2 Tax=Saitoella complicata (strain BCRC 22490 / CBS 7301 / JCM 7358 / NBRC 10748 / NRRL Y-17804) TaxID=698492 RepID=A0A0E9NG32_SAICN|nr:hypothetical protein G7K_3001-t1 [Saitoella complicata NRRL Y-17804]